MTWKNKRKIYGANAFYSIASKLRKQKKSSDEFEIMLNSLSLEEVIGLKLELACKAAGGKLFGLPLWYSLNDITKEAVFKYSLSATRTKKEAAAFLGISMKTFHKLQKKFNTEDYFLDFRKKKI
jgi:hypothetical protein